MSTDMMRVLQALVSWIDVDVDKLQQINSCKKPIA